MTRVALIMPWVIAAAALAAAHPARAQANLDARKSAAQIFADTCNACHRSAREIKPAGPGFLRQHYTTGGREAAAMAAYLAAIGSDPRAVQQRRPPGLGTGRAPASETPNRQTEAASQGSDTNKPTSAAAGKVRRPSDSIDASTAPAATEQPGATAASAVTHSPPDAFEE